MKPILIFSFLLMAMVAQAEELKTTPEPQRWKADAPDLLNFKIGTLRPGLDFALTSSDGNTELRESPSAQGYSFLSLNYHQLGLFFLVPATKFPDQEQNYGSGTARDIQFRIFGKQISQEYFYQEYQGFYISNTQELDPSFSGNLKQPNTKATHYGASFTYNFQPERYSMAAAYDQNGHQLTPGGAWLASVGLHNNTLEGSPLIPRKANQFGESETLQKGNFTQITVAGGYGYTYPFKSWYVTGQLMYGGGWQKQDFENADYVYTNWRTGNYTDLKFGFGYNGESNFCVIQAQYSGARFGLPGADLSQSSMLTSFHYGHRFGGVDIPFLNPVSAWLD